MPDTPLDARFELIDRITDFGLGEAWRARDLQVRGRAVVVKLLDAGALRDEALRRARSLRHGAVLPLLHHGAVDGRAYVAYEPFEAPTLSAWLSRVWRGDEVAPRTTLERIAERLCEALDAAHAQTPPLVHGRLSPDCVIVRATPQGVDLRSETRRAVWRETSRPSVERSVCSWLRPRVDVTVASPRASTGAETTFPKRRGGWLCARWRTAPTTASQT